MDFGCIFGICVLAARLTSLDVAVENNLPTKAMSYDGVERDISEFYKNDDLLVTAGGSLYLDSDTKVDLAFNNGLDTQKLDVSNTYHVGVTQYEKINDDWSITFGASATIGGEESHTPCNDSIDREYYCGNLTAWSDFEEPKHENDYSGFINLTYKF